MWSESLLSILEPQSDPALCSEAQGYIERGVSKANGRLWWLTRCYLRALTLYASDEEMSEVMVSRWRWCAGVRRSGILPLLQVLASSPEESIDVQICRILSSLCAAHTETGVGAERVAEV